MRHAGWLAILLMVSSVSAADTTDQKLDQILKELRSLSKRVTVLENRIAKMESKTTVDPNSKGTSRTKPIKTFRSIHLGPREVLRMQTEQPSSLLKDIHQRERVLRKRIFYPDVF